MAARRDFIIHYAYWAENAGLDTAQRFRHAVEGFTGTFVLWSLVHE
jgi:hypothetical protein